MSSKKAINYSSTILLWPRSSWVSSELLAGKFIKFTAMQFSTMSEKSLKLYNWLIQAVNMQSADNCVECIFCWKFKHVNMTFFCLNRIRRGKLFVICPTLATMFRNWITVHEGRPLISIIFFRSYWTLTDCKLQFTTLVLVVKYRIEVCIRKSISTYFC